MKCTDSPFYMSDDVADRLLAAYRNNNPHHEYHTLEDAGHHVHMDQPERVAKLINKFLGRNFKTSGTDQEENPPLKL